MNANQRRVDRLIIIIAILALTLWGTDLAAFGQDTGEPTDRTQLPGWGAPGHSPPENAGGTRKNDEAPDFGYSINTLVRSDARGVADASLITPYWTLSIGGDGDFGDHDTMGVFGRMQVRVDDVAGTFLSSFDWTAGELGNWTPGGRLTWWPQKFAAIWLEFAADVLRFGVDAEGQREWFVVGGSAWIDTATRASFDLFVGAQLDGLRIRLGAIAIDQDAPGWWARGPAPDVFTASAYLSIGWRG